MRLNRIDTDSRFKTNAILQGSMQQTSDKNRFYVLVGANSEYRKSYGSSTLVVSADVKNRFGDRNIFTASGGVKYTSKKLIAAAEAKYSSISNSDEPSYLGLSARAFYRPFTKSKTLKNLTFGGEINKSILKYPKSEMPSNPDIDTTIARVSVAYTLK